MTYAKPSDLLADMNSHGVFNAAMLAECEFDTSSVPVQTVADVYGAMEARGLGGWIDAEPTDLLITGWLTAEALATQYLGDNPGRILNGRGARFRACVESLTRQGY